MAIDVIAYTAYLAALVICGLAFWKGDRPLKLAAAAMIISWALSTQTGVRGGGINYPLTIIDTNLTLIFIWISTRWRVIWCAVLAALMLITVAIPFVAMIDPRIHLYNRAAANNVVAILQLIVMAVAIVLTVRARRRADEGAVRP